MGNNHISDELLAAFLEGNVTKEEMAQVLNAAAKDSETNEVLSIVMQLDEEEFPVLQIAAEGGRNLCDVKCEAYVLNKLGVQTSVDELFEVAKERRWLRRAGTPLFRIGNLLDYKGLDVSRKFNIYYFESANRKIIVHTKTGNIETYGKISDWENRLGNNFFRIHRSYLIQMKYVKKYNRTEAEMADGSRVLMSKYKYQEFLSSYMEYVSK